MDTTSLLNRKEQLSLLIRLRDEYPNVVDLDKIPAFDQIETQFNLFYLKGHGLIESGAERDTFGAPRTMFTARITSKGLDFLEQDGGISAILNTVTVKLDADTLRLLLQNKVNSSNLPSDQKETLSKKIQGFSESLLKDLVLKLAETALENSDLLLLIMKMGT